MTGCEIMTVFFFFALAAVLFIFLVADDAVFLQENYQI